MKWLPRFVFYSVLSGIIYFLSCNDALVIDEIPRAFVFEQINLDDFTYNDLKLIGGFVYIPGGVKGIIIYHNSSNSYQAFERNCPYLPINDCSIVSVDPSTLFLTDTCCSSNFDFDGNPISGPAKFPLLQYQTFLDGRILTISSSLQ